MHVWTNGSSHVVATGRGVAWGGDGGNVLFRFDPEKQKRAEEPRDAEGLAVLGPNGTNAIVVRQSTPHLVTRTGDSAESHILASPHLHCIASLDETRALVGIGQKGADGRERVVLAPATLDGRSLEVGAPIVLPAPARVAWPAGSVWEKGEEPWPEDDEEPDEENPFDPTAIDIVAQGGVGLTGRVRLTVADEGIVVTGTYSGIVALIDKVTLTPKWVMRTPTQDEAAIHGLATPSGVVVVLVVAGRESTMMLLSLEKGAVLANRSKLGRDMAQGVSMPVRVKDDLLVTDLKNGWSVALPALTPKKEKWPDGGRLILAEARAPDGTSLVVIGKQLGSPHTWNLARVNGFLVKEREELPAPDLRPAEKPVEARRVELPRRRGNPSLGLVAKAGSWSVNAGESISLEFKATNQGGPAAGFSVEIAGDAITSGLVVPESVTICGQTANFTIGSSNAKAELKEAKLDAGFEPPTVKSSIGREPPMPPPATEMSLVLKGNKAGQGLLTIRLGIIGAGSSGSAMLGRGFVVR